MITFTDTTSGSMIVRRDGLCVGILTLCDGTYSGVILNPLTNTYEEVSSPNRTHARAAAISIASY